MKIETQVTLRDNLRAKYYLAYTRPSVVFLCILFALIGIIMLVEWVNGTDIGTSNLVIGLFFIAYLSVLMPLMLYIQTKSHYKTNKNIQTPITYQFTEKGVELEGDDIQSKFPWTNVYKVRESKNFFYIYQNKVAANLLPKRFFTPQQITEFRALVKNNSVKSKLRKR